MLVGDPHRLRQVLLNLIGNAAKFTHEGEVVVRVKRTEEAGRLQFSVCDTGIGIPREKHQSIFGSFTQVDSSTTRQYGGSGLGLSICYRLAQLLGGRIWVESEVGRGATFHFTAAFEPAPGPQPSPEPQALAGVSILAADANGSSRSMIQDALTAAGAAVTCSPSGEAALSELRRARDEGHPYRLAILDSNLPDLDGYALAQELARKPDLTSGHLLLLSSRSEDLRRAHELGIQSSLVKPLKTAELVAACRVALRPGAAVSAITVPEPEPPRHTLRILLVEDSADNRLLIRGGERRGRARAVPPATLRSGPHGHADAGDGRVHRHGRDSPVGTSDGASAHVHRGAFRQRTPGRDPAKSYGRVRRLCGEARPKGAVAGAPGVVRGAVGRLKTRAVREFTPRR
jgi:CheY-like chemotaxis protein